MGDVDGDGIFSHSIRSIKTGENTQSSPESQANQMEMLGSEGVIGLDFKKKVVIIKNKTVGFVYC